MIKPLIAVTAMAAALTAGPVAGADQTFKARLSGDQEVPPVTDQGTSGKVDLQFNRDFTEGEFKLVVNAGVRVTQSHLHCGPVGVNGPIIVFFVGPPPTTAGGDGWDVDGQWISNATITNANIVNTSCGSTLAEIAHSASLGNVYANVHSVAKPAGVARGQLLPD